MPRKAVKKEEIEEKKNIFLFYGENTFAGLNKLNYWKTEFIKRYGDTDIEIIDGRDLDTAEFITNIGTLPFLSEKRLVIVKDFLSEGDADDQKKIAEKLSEIPDFCLVVFFENEIPDKRLSLFKKLSDIGKAEYFGQLSPDQAVKQVLEKAKAEDIKIDPPIATYFIDYCGTDPWTTHNELEKLKQYADGKKISRQMIDEVCVPSVSASVFKLTDAIAYKNRKESLRILKILLASGEEVNKIFFMIVRHFRFLIQVHDMINKKEPWLSIAKKVKQPPFVIKNMSTQAKNFSSEKLAEIYKKLLEIDIGVKTGKIKAYGTDTKEFELALEKLIINCCK